MPVTQAQYQIGEVVRHKLFDYIGVVFDADPEFDGSSDWYAQMARSKPPKDRPWYHVLVHGAVHTTYVAERNLEPSPEPKPIDHPLTDELFGSFDGERYHLRHKAN
jgi:heat shock protein HspQ